MSHSFKRFWGKIVFRYAGRNFCSDKTARTRAFYNIVGQFYDWLYSKLIADYHQSADYLAERFIFEGDTVLDLGCGTGLLIQALQKKADWVVGLDLSLGMLKQSKHKFKHQEKIDYVVSDCRACPIQGTFDKVVSSFMLVILERHERLAVLRQVFDMLADEGDAIFLTVREEISPEWLLPSEWEHYSSKAGFNSVEIIDIFDFYRIVCMKKRN